MVGEEKTVAAAASGEDAIHHVHTLRNKIEDLLRLADAHEVAGLVGGEGGGDVASDFAACFVGLADSEAADGVAGKIESHQRGCIFEAKVQIGPALDDGEEHLAGFVAELVEVISAADSPVEGARGSILGERAISGSFDALVEDHDDVCAQGDLDIEGTFRGKEMLGAIEMRAEGDALVGDSAQVGEAEHLKAA